MFLVDQPVIDLCAQPGLIFPNDYSHQENRESQLIYGETVEIIETDGEWVKIAALEQLCYHEKQGWHPYLGWVKYSELKEVGPSFVPPSHVVTTSPTLSFGTLVASGNRLISSSFCRQTLVADAHLFLATPYLWGGRSFHSKNYISGVDCSGLVNLLYRAQGIHIPRNAHDQYLASQPTHDLLPADPLYLAKGERINHVILKIAHNQFIESPETGKSVRLLHWGQEVWEKEGKIHFFDRSHPFTPYPRTFNQLY